MIYFNVVSSRQKYNPLMFQMPTYKAVRYCVEREPMFYRSVNKK